MQDPGQTQTSNKAHQTIVGKIQREAKKGVSLDDTEPIQKDVNGTHLSILGKTRTVFLTGLADS